MYSDLPLWLANPMCKDGLYSEAFPRQLLSDTPGVKKIFKLLLKCNIKTFNQPSSTHQPPSHSSWVSLVVSQQALAANDIHNCSFSLLVIMCSCLLENPHSFEDWVAVLRWAKSGMHNGKVIKLCVCVWECVSTHTRVYFCVLTRLCDLLLCFFLIIEITLHKHCKSRP